MSPGTKQGALTPSVYGVDGVDAVGIGAAVPLNVVTTLGDVTNIDLKFSFLPHVLIAGAGAGPQPLAPIRLTETAPGALVDGTDAISFKASLS